MNSTCASIVWSLSTRIANESMRYIYFAPVFTAFLITIPIQSASCQYSTIFNNVKPNVVPEFASVLESLAPSTTDGTEIQMDHPRSFFDYAEYDNSPTQKFLNENNTLNAFEHLAQIGKRSTTKSLMVMPVVTQTFLIARWEGCWKKFQSNSTRIQLTVLPAHQDYNRPSTSHVDLVWDGRQFELRQFRPVTTRRCSIERKISLIETVKMVPEQRSNRLNFNEESSQGWFSHQIEIAPNGLAKISYTLKP